ncbi:MAG: gamma-glutamyl-gamma-aminobutyrate hydrolase family protein [Kiritimatiellaeota bacterium]|nr:gamma-glutamyl-gamma-aminobutyrate hydrolase family protein [Kiritimatiellota bacterium]
MTRPLIGITARRPGAKNGSRVIGVPRDYIDAVVLAGGTPCLLPAITADAGALAILDRLDGLLLSGGGDVLPELYGRETHPTTTEVDPVRDRFEFALCRGAVDRAVPVLGICRGIQVMNAALGGTLIQDIPTEGLGDLSHYVGAPSDALAHPITCASGATIRGLLGTGTLSVNSRHHQAIDNLADGLRAAAIAPDGIIEAVESADGRAFLGVQFHPENLVQSRPRFLELFRWLIRKAAVERS